MAARSGCFEFSLERVGVSGTVDRRVGIVAVSPLWSGNDGPYHMELMARIQAQHLSYAVAGIGVGLAKGSAEVKTRFQAGFGKVWPLLLIVLGVLLMFYRE